MLFRPGAAAAVFIGARRARKAESLSSTDTLENTPQSETPEGAHGHEGHDHDHDHEHAHGPVLNPECTREAGLRRSRRRSFESLPPRCSQLSEICAPARLPSRQSARVAHPPPLCQRDPQGSDRRPAARALQQGRAGTGRPSRRPAAGDRAYRRRRAAAAREGGLRVPAAFSIDGYQDVKVEKPSDE